MVVSEQHRTSFVLLSSAQLSASLALVVARMISWQEEVDAVRKRTFRLTRTIGMRTEMYSHLSSGSCWLRVLQPECVESIALNARL